MITGFNTDVEYGDQVYHVQTEDKGLSNPVVVSLVYTGGEVVGSRSTSYADLLQASGFPDTEVRRRMESQHQAVIREIQSGRYDPEGAKPFGYNLVTNRSLDEVVLEFLAKELGVERIRVELERRSGLAEGMPASLRLRVLGDQSDVPIEGARVKISFVTALEGSRELFSGVTGHDGRVEASFEVPRLPGKAAALLCEAEALGNRADVKEVIRKAETPPPDGPRQP